MKPRLKRMLLFQVLLLFCISLVRIYTYNVLRCCFRATITGLVWIRCIWSCERLEFQVLRKPFERDVFWLALIKVPLCLLNWWFTILLLRSSSKVLFGTSCLAILCRARPITRRGRRWLIVVRSCHSRCRTSTAVTLVWIHTLITWLGR